MVRSAVPGGLLKDEHDWSLRTQAALGWTSSAACTSWSYQPWVTAGASMTVGVPSHKGEAIGGDTLTPGSPPEWTRTISDVDPPQRLEMSIVPS